MKILQAKFAVSQCLKVESLGKTVDVMFQKLNKGTYCTLRKCFPCIHTTQIPLFASSDTVLEISRRFISDIWMINTLRKNQIHLIYFMFKSKTSELRTAELTRFTKGKLRRKKWPLERDNIRLSVTIVCFCWHFVRIAHCCQFGTFRARTSA